MILRKVLVVFSVVLAAASAAVAWVSVFPTGLTISDPDRVSPGFVVFNTNSGSTFAVSNSGQLVNTWTSPDPARPLLGYSEPIPGGTLLTYLSLGIVPGCGLNCGDRIVELDLAGDVVWDYVDSERFLHHDFERLSNGNTMILCSRVLDVPEISDQTIVDDCVVEVDPAGQIVWQWQTADHYDELGLDDEARALIFAKGGDWGHANGAGVIPDDTSVPDPRFRPGNVFISYQSANLLIVVDRDTDEVVWTSRDVALSPHGINFLSDRVPGGGHFLVFDNGTAAGYPLRARSWSRLIEIDPLDDSIPYQYDATASGSPQPWSFYSHFKGVGQRLPNGNTLIVEGSSGRIFEVTAEHEIVWEFVNPVDEGGNDVFRAFRVPPSWPQTGEVVEASR